MPALLRRLDNDISRFVLADDLIDEPIGDFDVLGRIDLQTAQQIVLGDLLVDLDAWIDLDGTPEVLDGLDVVVLVGRRLELVDRIVDVGATVTVLLERRPVSLTLGLLDGVGPIGSSVRGVFGRVVNVRIVTSPETDDAATTSADAASESGQPTATDPRDADRGRETSAPTPDRQPQPSSPARDDSPTQSRPDAASAARSASTPRPDDRRSDSDRNRPLPATGPSSADGDLDAARDALVRSLEKFAEAAAATDDPRYAADCLEAAREAGETLATLR